MKKRILLSACDTDALKNGCVDAWQKSCAKHTEKNYASRPLGIYASEMAVVAALAGAMTLSAPVNAENVYTFDPSTMGTSTNIKWTQSSAAEIAEKGYEWKHTDVVPDTTNMVPVLDGTKLQSASGALRFNLPWKELTQTQYYIYEYTNPNSDKTPHARVNDDWTESITDAYFYNSSGSNGGAIYNTSTAGYSVTADFIGNTATGYYGGGAIYNGGGTITSITGDFIGNTSNTSGAIRNYSGTIGTIEGDFIGNTGHSGGAIYNNGSSAKITTITGDFIGNTAGYNGGAISNDGSSAKITTITGDFIGNTASSGGGAIYNGGGTITSITGDFIGNTASSSGGAIFNNDGGTIGTITGNFIGNTATNNSGGAIRSDGGTITSITGDFIGNSAISGGAIYNNGGKITNGITNSSFINNTATIGKGGAVLTSKDLTFVSDNGTTLFQGNTANGESNAIYMNKADGTLTFDIKNGGSAYMYDVIDGASGYNVTITGADKTADKMYLFNDIKNAGEITTNNITINTINNSVRDYNLTKLTSNATTNYAIDLNFANNSADKFILGSASSGTMTINSVNEMNLPTTLNEGDSRKFQVLDTTSAISLALYSSLSDEHTVYSNIESIVKDVTPTVKWNDTYGSLNKTTTIKGAYSLDTTSTTNDSIKLSVTDKEITEVWTDKYDTLKAWSEQTTTEDRNFNFYVNPTDTPSAKEYVVTKDLTTATSGTLNINGEAATDGTILSTINAQDTDSAKHTLFTITDGTTLNINNVIIKNAKTDTAAIDNTGVVNLNNVTFTSNTTDVNNNNELNITGGTVTINNGITGTGDTTVDGGNLAISDSSNGLTQKSLTIESGSVSANAEKITTTGNTITNKDILDFTGGTNSNAVTGTGTTQISGTVNNTANIQQDTIEITSTGNLSGDTSKLTLTSNTIKSDGVLNVDDSVISLNVTKNTAGGGTVNLNGANTTISSTISDNNVVFNGSSLTFSDPANNISSSNLTMNNGGLINLQNGTSGKELAMQNLTLKADTAINMDSDIVAGTMDSLKLSSFTNTSGNTLTINPNIPTSISTALTNPNIQMSPISKNSTMSASDRTLLASSIDMVLPSKITSPIFMYTPSYNSETGMMTLSGGGGNESGFNPAVLAAPAAAQAGAMTNQWNSYDQAFINMDMNMLFTREQRRAMKLQNKYALGMQRGIDARMHSNLTDTDHASMHPNIQASNRIAYDTQTPMVYSNTYLPERDLAAWVRPYTSFETVNLDRGPKVHNTMYGMYFGGDSEMYELKHNWDFQYSVYAGYNGSRQSYNDVTILQNGGTLGATGIFYHGDFFTGLTVNAGAGAANADTMYGHEDFAMLMTGIASKTGYNWELAKGRFIIQPSWLMSYSFVNTFDYTNAAGVRISSSPLHAIQLAPQLKFIGNLPHGWQPYASIQMVWNIMDETKFKANNVSLPDLGIKPYVQYGVGVQKRWGERFTGFFQTMIRNGSRTGVAFTLGFRWALGSQRDNKTGLGHSSTRTVIK